ncbi:MAG: hypothetical protein ACLUNZ_12905 [Evtepia sp.]
MDMLGFYEHSVWRDGICEAGREERHHEQNGAAGQIRQETAKPAASGSSCWISSGGRISRAIPTHSLSLPRRNKRQAPTC